MGHRSWLVEVKNEKEVKNVINYISKADEICDLDTFAHQEVFLKYDNRLWVGFASDGNTCGLVFEQSFLPKNRRFELLDNIVDPENIRYLTPKKFLNLLSPKSTEKQKTQFVRFLREEEKKRWDVILKPRAKAKKTPKAKSKKKKTQ